MKKLLSLLLIGTALSVNVPALASDDISVYIDGQQLQFDVEPFIIEQTTYVPMRKVLETLGAKVYWDSDNRRVEAYYQSGYMLLPIGSQTVYRNSIEQFIPTPAFISGGTTLIPLRLVSEYMGYNVEWDGNTRSVYITSSDKIQRIDYDNCYYVGEIANGQPSGYGTRWSQDTNEIIDIGLFYNGEITNGTRYYSDTSGYEGSFLNDEPHKGVYYTEYHQLEGDFSNGLNGVFTEYIYGTQTSRTIELVDGVETNAKIKELMKKRDKLSQQQTDLQAEYWNFLQKDMRTALGSKKVNKITNDIYEKYGVTSGNSSRKAAADAMIATTIMEQYNALSETYKAQIENYSNQIKQIDSMILTLYQYEL